MKHLQFLLLVLLIALFPKPSFAESPNDVTSTVENLGNPFLTKPIFGRNVWDMQLFNNRIYMGHGDSSANYGPIPVIYFDPDIKQFKTEYTVNEEQIEIFRINDGKLMIPGHDPKDNWEWGNFYVLEDEGWYKYRSLKTGLHTYDIYTFENKLFAAGSGQDTNWSNVQISMDKGLTWQKSICKAANGTIVGNCNSYARMHGLFELGGKLYSTSEVSAQGPTGTPWFSTKALRYLGGNEFISSDNTQNSFDVSGLLFKGWGNPVFAQGCTTNCNTPEWITGRVEQAVVHKPTGRTVYIGAKGGNDHHWTPFNLYSAKSLNSVEILGHRDAYGNSFGINIENAPSNSNWRARDVLIDETDNSIYVLGHIRDPQSGQYTITVHTSTDGVNFFEYLRFTNQTFARTFEKFNGYFYFGLGGDYISTTFTDPSGALIANNQSLPYAPNTGTILRVPINNQNPKPIPAKTPIPGTPVTKTFQINNGLDDVNEDGTGFSPSSSTVWFSNGASVTNDWLGLRFNNVTIPKGSIIDSAKVELYAPQHGIIEIRMFIAAEATGSATPFTSTSKPSQKMLTANKKNHFSDSTYYINNWYQLDQIKPVIQEVIDRQDWNSGNSLSVLMKGTGITWGRKFVSSYDGLATASAKLNVTYYPQSSPVATLSPSISPTPAAKPGDIDGNGKVDIFDYSQLLSDFGKTGTFAADLDKSGKVDIFDYNLVLSNFGK